MPLAVPAALAPNEPTQYDTKAMTGLEQPGNLTPERLELLADLIGPEWLESQLEKYRRFREGHSPSSRWWHRRPSTSPIVPMVNALSGSRLWPDEPHGVWHGDPTGILGRLVAAIVEFQPYWDALPNGTGRSLLRHVLRHPESFYGFRHEIRLATHLKGSGYTVEPLFLNPSSQDGAPDLIVHDRERTYAVQCKARNPSNSTDLSYDLFQFLAGSWSRMVGDSGKSLFLTLQLKGTLNEDHANDLIGRLRTMTRSEVLGGGRAQSEYWQAQLSEVGYGPGQSRPGSLEGTARSQGGDPLYMDIEDIRPAGALRPTPQVAGLYISGKKHGGLERFVFSAADRAAKEYTGKNALIVSVNLYQEADMSEYLNGPNVRPRYWSWQENFFRSYPKVAMLLVSSNYDRYLQRGSSSVSLGTKYLVIESPYWEGVLPDMGISG